MGIPMSFLRESGLPRDQFPSTDKIFDKYFGHDVGTFEAFHIAFLNFYMDFNSAMPGKHYRVPPSQTMMECYEKWKNTSEDDEEEKKLLIIKLVERHASIARKNNNAVLATGLVVPCGAMYLKKVLPPGCFFVPSCTLLAMAAVKAMEIYKATATT